MHLTREQWKRFKAMTVEEKAEFKRRLFILGEENLHEWGRLHRKYNTLGKKGIKNGNH